mgnify:CR=1 FL=1
MAGSAMMPSRKSWMPMQAVFDREICLAGPAGGLSGPQSPQDVTSNTQWSILYDNTALTAEAVIRRDWNTKPATTW